MQPLRNRTWLRRGRWLSACIAAIASLGCGAGAQPSDPTGDGTGGRSGRLDKHVLLLNSYHPQYRWTSELVRGARAELEQVIPEENLHVEYMDSRRFTDDRTYERLLIRLLRHKYAQFHPDVILSSDDHAFYFLLREGKRIFPGASIVFCGVNVFNPESLRGMSGITGILEGMDVRGNIDLIRRVLPKTKRIVLLSDKTVLGVRMTKHAREVIAEVAAEPGADRPRLEIWDSFSMSELYGKTRSLEGDAAILLLAIHKDRLGKYFSYNRDLPDLARASRAPIFGMWGTLIIEHGALGGNLNDPQLHGRNAAQMVARILRGEKASDMPIVPRAVYQPAFDYQSLQRFAIPLARLPPGTRVINRPESFYERHPQLVTGTLATFALLAFVIAVLALNIRRRQRAEAELRELNEELEERVERRTEQLQNKNSQLEQSRDGLARAHDDMRLHLSIARQIQASLLPLKAPAVRGARAHARYISLHEVGGDFLHYFDGGPDRLGILIADATGHGVPAALLGTMAKMLLEAGRDKMDRPAEILALLDEGLRGKSNQHFVTACYGVYDAQAQGLTYALGGHPAPLLLRSGETIRQLPGRGPLVGILDDASFTTNSLPLHSGDQVLFLTDGILDCRGPDGDDLTPEQLVEILNGLTAGGLRGEALLDGLLGRLRDFMGQSAFEDDVTLILLGID